MYVKSTNTAAYNSYLNCLLKKDIVCLLVIIIYEFYT